MCKMALLKVDRFGVNLNAKEDVRLLSEIFAVVHGGLIIKLIRSHIKVAVIRQRHRVRPQQTWIMH